jgi:hypothetical protein
MDQGVSVMSLRGNREIDVKPKPLLMRSAAALALCGGIRA